MGQQCAVCGKKPAVGNQYSRRGKAKYLGGVGRKVTGISKRTFKPNLQSLQCQGGGSVRAPRGVRAVHPQRQGPAPEEAKAVLDGDPVSPSRVALSQEG